MDAALVLSELPDDVAGLFFELRRQFLQETSSPVRDHVRHLKDALRMMLLVQDTKALADAMLDFEQREPRTEPLYHMIVDGRTKFLPLKEAGAAFDSGWIAVEVGTWVLEPDFTLRVLTKEDGRAISEEADEHSERK